MFGINNLCSGEMPHLYAEPPCLGPSVQLLCNRYFASDAPENAANEISPTGLFDHTSLLRKARFSPSWREDIEALVDFPDAKMMLA